MSLRKLPLSKWEELLGEQVTSSPTAKLLGYSNEEDNPDILPHQYKYLAYEAIR